MSGGKKSTKSQISCRINHFWLGGGAQLLVCAKPQRTLRHDLVSWSNQMAKSMTASDEIVRMCTSSERHGNRLGGSGRSSSAGGGRTAAHFEDICSVSPPECLDSALREHLECHTSQPSFFVDRAHQPQLHQIERRYIVCTTHIISRQRDTSVLRWPSGVTPVSVRDAAPAAAPARKTLLSLPVFLAGPLNLRPCNSPIICPPCPGSISPCCSSSYETASTSGAR